MSRYRQSLYRRGGIVGRPIEGVTRKREVIACYFGAVRYDNYYKQAIV